MNRAASAATRSEQAEAKVDQQAPMSPTAASGAATADGAMAPGDSSAPLVVYDVEHLATFSTSGSHETNNGNKANMDDADERNRTTAAAIATSSALPAAGELPASTTTPKKALQRLFELEKLSGIWTQHMQIELRGELMLIIDCETNSVVERFSKSCVTRPEAFNHYNDIYNNIVVFIIIGQHQNLQQKQQQQHHQSSTASTSSSSTVPSDSSFESSQLESTLEDSQREQEEEEEGELHIFQCVSHKAQQLVVDILEWKSSAATSTKTKTKTTTKIISDSQLSGKPATTMTPSSSQTEKKKSGGNERQQTNERAKENMKSSNLSSPSSSKPPVVVTSAASGCGETVPIVNVNVKETVQVFNQIAALREKSSKPTSPTNRSSSDAANVALNTASDLSPATSAGNSDHHAGKMALSPGSQLYKQRSIRATLAPKYASGTESSQASQVITKSTKVPDESSASSSPSSSESKAAPTATAYGAANRHHHHHQLANSSSSNNNNNSDQLPVSGKQQVTNGAGSSSSPAGRSSSTNHHYQQQHHHHQNGNTHQNNHHSNHHHNHKSSKPQQQRTPSDSTRSSHASSSSQSQLDQVTTNESYVSVLNHCFDDIEKFIIRLQQAMTAFHELQANSKRKLATKRSNQNNVGGQVASGKTSNGGGGLLSSADLALLSARAQGPSEDDYYEILSKFKLAFNLLAKLKGCIHEPNAPELVHFLFTPLAIIIESARNASPPIDPTLVGIPYLNQDALDLLSNCCTSKESDMWLSLGPNWTQTIDMSLLNGSRLPSSFQPLFSDGWAPVIGELELIGLVAPPIVGGTASSVATTVTVATELPASRLSPPVGHHRVPGGGYAPLDDAITSSSYAQPPQPLQLDQNYASGKLNGQDQTKIGLPRSQEHKKRNGSHRHSSSQHPEPMVDSYHHSHVLDPYGYLHSQPEQQDYHQLRSRRLNQATKQSSRLHNSSQQDYNKSASNYGYGSSSGAPPPMLANHHFPPMNLHHHHHPTNMDGDHLADAETIVDQSDDYSELHDHYDAHHHHQQHHHEGAAGPSHLQQQHHHYHHHQLQHQHQQLYPRNSNDFNHNKRQGSSAATDRKQAIGGNLYNQAPFAAAAAVASADDHQSDYLLSEQEQEAMLLDLGPAQTEWFYELQSRGAMIVRVLFTREANNDKELSVHRGEVLEVLDDTRKWWRARNINLQVAHVPHTIVAIMQGYQTLDELLANNPGDEHNQPSLLINSANHHHHHSRPGYNNSRSHHSQRPPATMGASNNNYSHQWREAAAHDKRKSSTSGAFRYF